MNFLIRCGIVCFLALPAFAEAWSQTSHFPKSWKFFPEEPSGSLKSFEKEQVRQLPEGREYSDPQVPPGLNTTVWFRNTLPVTLEARDCLFFKNGLEDLQIYIDGVLRYDYGRFDRSWSDVTPQRWHCIPLKLEDAGKSLLFRTHYAFHFTTKTLFPEIISESETPQRIMPMGMITFFAAGTYLVLSFAAFTVVMTRRQRDVYCTFTLLTFSISCWVLFNQDSTFKPFLGVPQKYWGHIDIISLYIGLCLAVSFCQEALKQSTLLTRLFLKSSMALMIAGIFGSLSGLLHPWYFLPFLHFFSCPLGVVAFTQQFAHVLPRKDRKALLLALGFLVSALTAAHDVLRYFPWFPKILVSAIPFGFLFLFGTMAKVLSLTYRDERREASQTREKLIVEVRNLNRDLERNLQQVEAVVYEKTRDILSILRVTQQGIFMIGGDDLHIYPEHSLSLCQMLGRKTLADASFVEIFLSKCTISSDQLQQIHSSLISSLHEEKLSFELNSHVLPQEVTFSGPHGPMTIEMSWEPMVDEHDHVEKFLITLRDVSHVKALQKEAATQAAELRTIGEILSNKSETFARFLQTSSRFLQEARNLVGSSPQLDQLALYKLYSILHTLKGDARTMRLEGVSNMIHHSESVVQDILRQSQGLKDQAILMAEIETISQSLQPYASIFHDRLKMGSRTQSIILSPDQARSLVKEWQSQPTRTQLQDELTTYLLSQLHRTMADLCLEAFAGKERLARELGKIPPQIEIQGEGLYLSLEIADSLYHVLGHLLRNALDHSLETPDERLRVGKRPQGRIRLVWLRHDNSWSLHIADDGKGLDLIKIQQKAYEKGLTLNPSARLDAESCQKAIFSPGFSTQGKVSLVSGRGVGLDAVSQLLMRAGVSLHLEFEGELVQERYQSFALVLNFPPQSILEWNPNARTEGYNAA